MNWLLRTFGRSFVWKLGAMAAIACVGLLSKCYAQTIECASACTVTVVHEFPGPFTMSIEDGAILSGLIISCWVSALIFRWFIRMLRDRDTEE